MQYATILQPQTRPWLEGSILRPYVSQYGKHLQRRRYAPNTQRAYLSLHRALRPLADSGTVRLGSDRPGAPLCVFSRNTCRRVPAPTRSAGLRHDLQAALGHLLEVLEAGGVAATVSGPQFRYRTGVDALRCPYARRLGFGGEHPSAAAQSGREVSCRAFQRAAHLHDDSQAPHPSAASSLANRGAGPAAIAAFGVTIACYLRFRSIVRRPGEMS